MSNCYYAFFFPLLVGSTVQGKALGFEFFYIAVICTPASSQPCSPSAYKASPGLPCLDFGAGSVPQGDLPKFLSVVSGKRLSVWYHFSGVGPSLWMSLLNFLVPHPLSVLLFNPHGPRDLPSSVPLPVIYPSEATRQLKHLHRNFMLEFV